MKKAIALLFLLLANISLLVHAVVPHHHHDDIAVCFATACCADNDEASQCHHDSGGHRHDGDTQPDGCALKEVYVRFENGRLFADSSPDYDSQYPVLYLLPINSVTEVTVSEKLPFRNKPYLLSYHTALVARSIGLRAPPM